MKKLSRTLDRVYEVLPDYPFATLDDMERIAKEVAEIESREELDARIREIAASTLSVHRSASGPTYVS